MDQINIDLEELSDAGKKLKENAEIALKLIKDKDVILYLNGEYPFFLGGAHVALGNRIPLGEISSAIRDSAESNKLGAVKIWNSYNGNETNITMFVLAYFGVDVTNDSHDCRLVMKPRSEFEEKQTKKEVIYNTIANSLIGNVIPGFSLMAKSENRAENRRKEKLYKELSGNILENPLLIIFDYFNVRPKMDFDKLFEEFKQINHW